MITPGPVGVVGAGPTGALIAVLLERRGFEVTLYDHRRDPRGMAGDSGRSINLALAGRGIHALKSAGVFDPIEPSLMPLRGRMVHARDGARALQPYGQRPGEVIYSVSRHRLRQMLIDMAVREHAVAARFEHRLAEVDFERGIARLAGPANGAWLEVAMQPLLAADGAGSELRRRMAAAGLIHAHEADLEHGYKELTIPPDAHGGYVLEPDALHIWPRGAFMLIALPNTDGSFTATLFLPKRGAVSFETLATPVAIEQFMDEHFADVVGLMPDARAQLEAHPLGFLGTVYADRWNNGAQAALIGDAAHAIVPFHGQGMNCCFEDCLEFDACVAAEDGWEAAFERFFRARKPNTDAIAAMAQENYLEMRQRVADPKFQMQQALALELERRHPQRFIPRYSMVMFHPEIPYRTAFERGRIQSRLLTDLTATAPGLEAVDYARAARDINRDLAPIARDPA